MKAVIGDQRVILFNFLYRLGAADLDDIIPLGGARAKRTYIIRFRQERF